MTSSRQGSESVRRQFGRVAAEYATSSYHASGPDLVSLVNAAHLTGSERALDIGCGAGHTAFAVAPLVREVVACDVTEAMIEQTAKLANEKGITNLTVQMADAASLPFDDDRFDVVASRVAAHHFADIRAAVSEMARVLAPNGRLLIADSYSPSEPMGADEVLHELEVLRDASHVRNYRLEEWTAMLSDVGLETRFVESWEVRQEFEAWVRRMRTPQASISALKQKMDATPEPIRERLGIVAGAYDVNIPIALMIAEVRG